MDQLEKPWWRSKKFLALLMLVCMTTGLISASVIVGINPDVLQSMVTILGGTTGVAGAGYIGGQAHVDGKVRPALINAVFESEE